MDPIIEGPLISFNSFTLSASPPQNATPVLIDANYSPIIQPSASPIPINPHLQIPLTPTHANSTANNTTPRYQLHGRSPQTNLSNLPATNFPNNGTQQSLLTAQIQPRRLNNLFDANLMQFNNQFSNQPHPIIHSQSNPVITQNNPNIIQSPFVVVPTAQPPRPPSPKSPLQLSQTQTQMQPKPSYQHHRRSLSETDSSTHITPPVLDEDFTFISSVQQLSPTTTTQTLMLMGVYDDPATKAILVDSFTPPLKFKYDSLQHHFNAFYEDLFTELSKYGHIEDLAVCENYFIEFRYCVLVKYGSIKDSKAAFEGISSKVYDGRRIETKFVNISNFYERRCVDFDKSSCVKGNLCCFLHIKQPTLHVQLKLLETQHILQTLSVDSLNKTIFLRNIPRHFAEPEIRNYFETFGRVKACRYHDDSNGKLSAFLEFENEQSVKSALTFDGKMLKGQIFRIENMNEGPQQSGWGSGSSISNTPLFDGKIVISSLPPHVGAEEVKEFITTTLAREMNIDGSNIVSKVVLDNEEHTATIQFVNSYISKAVLCLNKVSFKDHQIKLSRMIALSENNKLGKLLYNGNHSGITFDCSAYVMNKLRKINQHSRSDVPKNKETLSPRNKMNLMPPPGMRQKKMSDPAILMFGGKGRSNSLSTSPVDELFPVDTSPPTELNIIKPTIAESPRIENPQLLNPFIPSQPEALISFENSKAFIPAPPPPPPRKAEYREIHKARLSCSPDEKLEELDLGDNEIDYNDLQIIKQIGEGGYGTVKSATWRGKLVAVKQLHLNNKEEDFIRKFRKEVAILSKLRHPNVLLFMAVTKPPNICLVTEYLVKSMWDLLHNPKVVLSMKFLFRTAKDVALGMNYLHLCEPAIIHRDLKSPNLMLDEGNNIKICDFGLSRIKEETVMTGRIGTPAWTAPEVLRTKPYSEKADVYSYGIVLYEFFSRQVPFPNMEPIQIAIAVVNGKMRPPIPPSCPPVMRDLMQDCWDEDPEKRPSFAQILDRFNLMLPQFMTSRDPTGEDGLTVL